jgi:ABC-type transporter Mla MlaB component
MALDIGSETHGDFAAGERRFIVDLAGISYVSSAGLRVLLALAKQMSSGGGELRLCGLAPSVRQVFDLSGFSKLFAISADVESALGEKSGGSTAAATPEVSKAAANLLGATSSSTQPAPPPQQVGRQAADLLGARQPPKRGLFARLMAWFKGQ